MSEHSCLDDKRVRTRQTLHGAQFKIAQCLNFKVLLKQ